jgi:hypothetical protein
MIQDEGKDDSRTHTMCLSVSKVLTGFHRQLTLVIILINLDKLRPNDIAQCRSPVSHDSCASCRIDFAASFNSRPNPGNGTPSHLSRQPPNPMSLDQSPYSQARICTTTLPRRRNDDGFGGYVHTRPQTNSGSDGGTDIFGWIYSCPSGSSSHVSH